MRVALDRRSRPAAVIVAEVLYGYCDRGFLYRNHTRADQGKTPRVCTRCGAMPTDGFLKQATEWMYTMLYAPVVAMGKNSEFGPQGAQIVMLALGPNPIPKLEAMALFSAKNLGSTSRVTEKLHAALLLLYLEMSD